MTKRFVVFIFPLGILAIWIFGCSRNEPPVIDNLATDPASDTIVTVNDTVKVVWEVSDADGDSLTVELTADGGSFSGTVQNSEILWVAPDYSGAFTLTCTVYDADTINKVTGTLGIQVQNYMPMARNNWWYYEDQVVIGTAILKDSIRSQEIMGDGGTRWHIKRFVDAPSIPAQTDTFSYYTEKGDSVFFYDISLDAEFLLFLMPLWLDKTWAADGNMATGTVEEMKDRGTKAGNFFNCMRVELRDLANGQEDRTFWVASDVGIIEQTLEIPGVPDGAVEFELTDYGLE